MIALHIGLESTMNLHIFEMLSIIGWCMFFIQPDLSYQEYTGNIGTCRSKSSIRTRNTATDNLDSNKATTNHVTAKRYFLEMIQNMWIINAFLLTLTIIFMIDMFPLLEIHVIVGAVMARPPETTASHATHSFLFGLSQIGTAVQTLCSYLLTLRTDHFFPFLMKYIYPIGLYQGVWDLYSDPASTCCYFVTNITAYSIITNGSAGTSSTYHQQYSYVHRSPDTATMTWYTKKRYQRPMTMDFSRICRDCYVRYHANNIINDALKNDDSNITNMQFASATLMGHCENAPPPPSVDDWFNWSGWFFADAKQSEYILHDPILFYSTNICNDLNVEMCREYLNEGYCEAAQNLDTYRHSFKNGTIRTDYDKLAYNITQTCRQSCKFCPEDGYDADNLKLGTRISIFWPAPKWSYIGEKYKYDEASGYYDCKIVQVKDRPLKQYLLKYDNATYGNEWFDPMTLRDLGYHLLPINEHLETEVSSALLDDINNNDDDDAFYVDEL